MKNERTPKAKTESARDQKKRLAKLTVAQQKAGRKVTKLRERLARAETKLANHTALLDGARSAPERPSHPASVPTTPVPVPALPIGEPSPVADSAPYQGERETPPAPAKAKAAGAREKRPSAPIRGLKAQKVNRNSHIERPAPVAAPNSPRVDGDA